MRVLGIDPGSRFTGYGLVEEDRGKLRHLAHGVIKTDGDSPLEARLHEIFVELSSVFALFRPDAVAVEGLFSFKNARSALVLGHARGVALLVAAQGGLAVHEYSPAKVKKSIGAGGAGAKDAVARMVATFLRLPELTDVRADASDALAVALCHLNHQRRPVAVSGSRVAQKAAPTAAFHGKQQPKRFAHLVSRLAPAYVRPTGSDP